ncbi:hypothetical protein KP77_13710 [Jeotgalibacillus alimentarius]|uniref:Uncharacterized protein n=1 Tax=Jeotgalibacillus alimentarius TaxID=135826 RepID=A0A0C2W293_9BACL|nr:hypothetical protein KP77_13710 [Jeotgalibacillus alimentarius]
MYGLSNHFITCAMLKTIAVLAQLVIGAEGGRLQQEQRDR